MIDLGLYAQQIGIVSMLTIFFTERLKGIVWFVPDQGEKCYGDRVRLLSLYLAACLSLLVVDPIQGISVLVVIAASQGASNKAHDVVTSNKTPDIVTANTGREATE